jgi:hypothetical protein
MRRRTIPHLIRKCLGFIFFDLFSSLGRTGCRRGRTPERPLRQPPKVWPVSQTFFFALFPRISAVDDCNARARALQSLYIHCNVCAA